MGFNDGPRQGGYRSNFNSEDRQMFDATCSECKQACKVPFKPTAGKPVFCKECYAKKNPRRY